MHLAPQAESSISMRKIIAKYLAKKWPISVDGYIYEPSQKLTITCTNECLADAIKNNPEGGVFFCKHNLSYHHRLISGNSITICAVDIMGSSGKGRFFGTKDQYKKLRGSTDEIEEIFANALDFIEEADSELDKRNQNTFTSLHEVDKWSGELNRLAHRLITEQGGLDFTEKYNSSPNLHKSIYETASLLKDTLDYLAISLNDLAAKKNLTKTSVYSVTLKIATIINNAQAKSENKKIKLSGNNFTIIPLYDSFKLILLSILTNAIKYSVGGQSIDVSFSEDSKTVMIDIESMGYHIEDSEINKIFEKGYRGINIPTNKDGHGLGLYVAKICATVNKIDMSALSKLMGTQLSGKPLALVKFKLRIPKSGA